MEDDAKREAEPASEDSGQGSGLARRSVLGGMVAAAMAGVASVFAGPSRVQAGVSLRPPGALPEDEFLDKCARCFECANACPNDCIQFHGLEAGLGGAFTPFIKARERGCVLCGECANVCPTGALKPFEATREGWLIGVEMGKARVNEEMCFSFHGRTCGACYQACPLAGQAMTIGLYETPHVNFEDCVGCGLCEQACLHLPQAIRVLPVRRST